MAAPTVRSVGAYSTPGNTTPHSVATPAGFQSGDVLLAVFEGQTGTAGVTATGWTLIFNVAQPSLTPNTRLCIVARIADGSEGSSVAFDIPAVINHVSGRMMAIQNHSASTVGKIVVDAVGAVGGAGGSPQTNTVPGITVSPNALVCIVGSSALDLDSTTQFSGWTNANLTSITEQMDNVTSFGNGGGFGLATGACAGTTTGSSTYQQATGDNWVATHLAIPGTDVTVAVSAAIGVGRAGSFAVDQDVGAPLAIATAAVSSPTIVKGVSQTRPFINVGFRSLV